MAASLNKVSLIGRLCADPEVRSLNNGGKVVNLRVATNETWKDRDGNRQERAEYHQVVIFNEGLAKVAESYLRKGSQCFIEGQLQTRKWTDQSGSDRYSTEIVLQKYRGELLLLDSKQESGGGHTTLTQQPEPVGLDDDIPFASCDPSLECRVS